MGTENRFEKEAQGNLEMAYTGCNFLKTHSLQVEKYQLYCTHAISHQVKLSTKLFTSSFVV